MKKKNLELFVKRHANGVDPTGLVHWAVVRSEGRPYYRYRKVIPTDGVCLSSHGENIDTEVAVKLDLIYLKDKARGYKAGVLRGAFAVRGRLD
ncbi:MAG: c-type heme family protein [Gammaproteobacteria bacterium]